MNHTIAWVLALWLAAGVVLVVAWHEAREADEKERAMDRTNRHYE